MIVGEKGIVGKATKSKEETLKAEALEDVRLIVLEVQTKHEGHATLEQVVEKLAEAPDRYKVTTLVSKASLTTDSVTANDVKNVDKIYVTNEKYNYEVEVTMDMKVTLVEKKHDKDDEKPKDDRENYYYASVNISNLTPYGYDIYINGVSEEVKTVKYPTWTETNGQDDLIWYVTSKIQDGTFYGRVNIHNQESGKYITHLYFYDESGNTLTTGGREIIVPSKNKSVTNITADSIISGIRDNNIPTGYCDMTVNGKTYNLEVVNIDEFYKYNQEKSQYEIRDFAAGSYNVSRTAVIKCNGNLQIDGYVTSSAGNIDGNNGLTKVKGLYICTNGTLTNNGTISMTARGTYNTPGEDIYLWKNIDGTYETVPADGGAGGSYVGTSTKGSVVDGNSGANGTTRQTGGGGSGAVAKSKTASASYTVSSGAGSKGTSYSGGSGGGGSAVRTGSSSKDSAESGYGNGGAGGQGNSNRGSGNSDNYKAGGGAGNPGGENERSQHVTDGRAPTGTGGLLIIYANTFNNQNSIVSAGVKRRRSILI